MLIALAEGSKARFCDRSLAGVADSNPAGVMDVSLVNVMCVVRQRSQRQADHSSRGVLPTVVCITIVNRKTST